MFHAMLRRAPHHDRKPPSPEAATVAEDRAVNPRTGSLLKESYLLFGSVYLVLSLINLRVKLLLTPAWYDGTLERNHQLLLNFSYTNNEQSRLLQFYLPEILARLFPLSVPDAYLVQRWSFTLLAFCCFHHYLRRWFGSELAFAGVLLLACVMPLTYFNHLQESAPLLALTFLLALWAIRDRRTLVYTGVLLVGAVNNETMLFLPAVHFFHGFRNWKVKSLGPLLLRTVACALPAYLAVGVIRYLNRDRPHLGGAWHLPDNVVGILRGLVASPIDWWETSYLYLFFVYGVLWVFAWRRFADKPLFLQRSLLTVPLFIIPHLVTGIILEVRQMLPLAFIIIPAALFALFRSRQGSPQP